MKITLDANEEAKPITFASTIIDIFKNRREDLKEIARHLLVYYNNTDGGGAENDTDNDTNMACF